MKKLLCWTYVLIVLLALCTTGVGVVAGVPSVNIAEGDITITANGYTVGSGGETPWTGSSHELTITGTSTDNTIIVSENTECTLTLQDVSITSQDAPAISIGKVEDLDNDAEKEGANVILVIAGENTLKGGDGFAGIEVLAGYDVDENYDYTYSVRKSGKLEIQGDGTLTVTGGSTTSQQSGGAGIGGNGNGEGYDAGADFGVIYISEKFTGIIMATGGSSNTISYGSGAGIGGGGTVIPSYVPDDVTWEYNGNITICGGVINANGGDAIKTAEGHLPCGAAGIGTGSLDTSHSGLNNLVLSISGGTITAKGGSGAAGIGGGANVGGETIDISGGTITAKGKHVGTGIGGGENAGFVSITIGGDAKVTAYGSTSESGNSGSPGIGGTYIPAKNDAGQALTGIIIKDNAEVCAYGGNHASGIGVTVSANTVFHENTAVIDITSDGEIIAIAGSNGQALSVSQTGDPNSELVLFHIGENANVWAFNKDSELSAINWDGGTFNLETEVIAVGYTKPEESTFPTVSVKTAITNSADAAEYEWQYETSDNDNTIKIFKKDTNIILASNTQFQNGNWAYLGMMEKPITIDIQKTGSGTLKKEDTVLNTGDSLEVAKGDTIVFSATPDYGYKVGSVTFNEESIQPEEDGTYTITPDVGGTFSVEFVLMDEDDIKEGIDGDNILKTKIDYEVVKENGVPISQENTTALHTNLLDLTSFIDVIILITPPEKAYLEDETAQKAILLENMNKTEAIWLYEGQITKYTLTLHIDDHEQHEVDTDIYASICGKIDEHQLTHADMFNVTIAVTLENDGETVETKQLTELKSPIEFRIKTDNHQPDNENTLREFSVLHTHQEETALLDCESTENSVIVCNDKFSIYTLAYKDETDTPLPPEIPDVPDEPETPETPDTPPKGTSIWLTETPTPDIPPTETPTPDVPPTTEDPTEKDNYLWHIISMILVKLLLLFLLLLLLIRRIVYRLLKKYAKKYDYEYERKHLKEIAREIIRMLRNKDSYPDWRKNPEMEMRLRADIIRVLDTMQYPAVPREEIVPRILKAGNGKLSRYRL